MSSSMPWNKNPDSSQIYCVIVAYRPQCTILNEKIRALSTLFKVVAVSNADSEETRNEFSKLIDPTLCLKIPLGDNLGIGSAQNVGINEAINRGAGYILLLDDDSDISNENILALLERYCELKAKGLKIGAVAPAVIDAESTLNIVHKLDHAQPYTVIRDLMSSGTLIPVEIFQAIGLMREDLFIDCVDYEWGWRCGRAGFALIVDNQIKIRHKLGQSSVACLPGVEIRVPSPIRHYYQFRNVIALVLYGSAPARWRIRNALALMFKFPAYLILLDERSKRAGYIFSGILHGLRNRMGRHA